MNNYFEIDEVELEDMTNEEIEQAEKNFEMNEIEE